MSILLLSLLSLVTQYYRLDTATEEGFRHLELHDIKIWIFENAGLFWVFENQVTIVFAMYLEYQVLKKSMVNHWLIIVVISLYVYVCFGCYSICQCVNGCSVLGFEKSQELCLSLHDALHLTVVFAMYSREFIWRQADHMYCCGHCASQAKQGAVGSSSTNTKWDDQLLAVSVLSSRWFPRYWIGE